MKVRRRVFALLLSLLFCLYPPLTASAESGASEPPAVSSSESAEDPAQTTPADQPEEEQAPPAQQIVRACVEDIELPMVRRGEPLTGLELPDMLRCKIDEHKNVDCPVIWEPLESVDTGRPGWTFLRGILLPPAGNYALPDNPTVELPVMVYEEGMEPEPLCENTATTDGEGTHRVLAPTIMPQGGNYADFLPFLSYQLQCTASNGMTFYAPIQWDLSEFDPQKRGRYVLRGEPELPPCFTLPESFQPLTVTVSVLCTDFIDLLAPTYSRRFKTVTCKWYYKIQDLADVSLEYAVNDGAWQKEEFLPLAGAIMFQFLEGKHTGVLITENQMGVTPALLPGKTGDNFYFRLIYNGQTSDVLHIWYDDTAVEWSGEIGGDRDGGDYVTPKPPILIQRPPAGRPSQSHTTEAPAEEKNASGEGVQSGSAPLSTGPAAPAAVAPAAAAPAEPAWEQVTDTATLISGARLSGMIAANPDTVLFEKQGVSVELPSDFLRELALPDDAMLEVRIERPQERSFQLEITVNGAPVTALSEAVVRFPLTLEKSEDPSRLICLDAEGAIASGVAYDAQNRVGSMTIDAAGVYLVVCGPEDAPGDTRPTETVAAPAEPPANVQKQPNPAVFAAVAVLSAAGLGALLLWVWRRRTPHG